MAVWTTPITWANGGLTAANLNSVRDNLVWLKAFADLITDATADDEGDDTYLNIVRATGPDFVLRTEVTGEAFPRFLVSADGMMQWGGGAATFDVILSRQSAKALLLDDAQLRVSRAVPANPAFVVRDDADTTSMWLVTGDGVMEFVEQATGPAAPGANRGIVFMRDNGAGKTQLVAQFNTGAVQVIATQP